MDQNRVNGDQDLEQEGQKAAQIVRLPEERPANPEDVKVYIVVVRNRQDKGSRSIQCACLLKPTLLRMFNLW